MIYLYTNYSTLFPVDPIQNHHFSTWGFPRMVGIPKWLRMENPIKVDDLGLPLF